MAEVVGPPGGTVPSRLRSMPSLIIRISLDPPGRSLGLRVVLVIERLTGVGREALAAG